MPCAHQPSPVIRGIGELDRDILTYVSMLLTSQGRDYVYPTSNRIASQLPPIKKKEKCLSAFTRCYLHQYSCILELWWIVSHSVKGTFEEPSKYATTCSWQVRLNDDEMIALVKLTCVDRSWGFFSTQGDVKTTIVVQHYVCCNPFMKFPCFPLR